MRQFFFFLFAILLGVGMAFALRTYLDHRRDDAARATEKLLPQLQPNAETEPHSPNVSVADIEVRSLPPTDSPPENKPPTSDVEYRVEEGFAVAHGDILVGTLESGAPSQGLTTLQNPQAWDRPEIPYAIDADVPNPGRISEAIRHIEHKTGIRFVPYQNQPDAILFQKGEKHCVSALGRQGGLQPIRISARCRSHEITHEVLHALGCIHEQSRVDRDNFVRVLWHQIDPAFQDQFAMLPAEFLGPAKGTAFDYGSIMLYDPQVFAKEKGMSTMESTTEAPIRPSSHGMSAGDAQRVRRFFRLD